MSKSVIGAIMFAIALWAYSNLNYTYTTRVSIPLEFKLPANQAVDSMPTNSVSVQVRGTGWHLFNLIFFNTSARCFVDLSEENATEGGQFSLSRNELLKNIQYITNVDAVDILPENLTIETGKIASKYVRIKPNIKIDPRKYFIIVGNLKLDPDSVEITGNANIINEIDYWSTKYMTLDDVNIPQSVTVNLSDSLNEIISISPSVVRLQFDVQQLASRAYPDIPVQIDGGALPSNHVLEPNMLTLYIEGGIEKVAGLSYDDIRVSIEYLNIIEDTTGILTPRVDLPDGIRLLRMEPDAIYHFREEANLNNINL